MARKALRESPRSRGWTSTAHTMYRWRIDSSTKACTRAPECVIYKYISRGPISRVPIYFRIGAAAWISVGGGRNSGQSQPLPAGSRLPLDIAQMSSDVDALNPVIPNSIVPDRHGRILEIDPDPTWISLGSVQRIVREPGFFGRGSDPHDEAVYAESSSPSWMGSSGRAL